MRRDRAADFECILDHDEPRPASFGSNQHLPHFDTSDPHELAVVHYLCDARHDGTGYETIHSPARHA